MQSLSCSLILAIAISGNCVKMELAVTRRVRNRLLETMEKSCGRLECCLSLRQRDYPTLFSSFNGKNFALRGGNEHSCFKISQIVRNNSPEGKLCYTYTENCSKNRASGFNQFSVPNKVVHQYQDFEAGQRCHVTVLDKFLSKLPPNARDKDIFYLRPVARKNPLSRMMTTMCKAAEIPGNKTNHSLRAYAASELFNAGILEKVIQAPTGHRSLDGLRKYENISGKQKEDACKVFAV